MEKIKNLRLFTFKAYVVNESEEVLKNAHKGEFLFKSDCHYYVEKFVLDFVKNNLKNVNAKKYLIYKISTIEDTNVEDLLIEQIFVKDDKINII